ncbi:MAG: peptidoglycan DD-metalloendopeptidase family protein [Ardenticatenaceae bacterium]|nr:peptidoglycan DD-metalloendopeptidase family protein [Ardenticatenaceae bacterium]MCB8988403.1 peptidoglycan DD-metalloendopeptidase family protein [Ardenticatenaceae bacterium]
MKRPFFLLLIGVLALVGLAACQQAVVANTAVGQPTAVSTPLSTPPNTATAVPPPPALVVTSAPAASTSSETELPSFAAVDPDELTNAKLAAEETATAVATPTENTEDVVQETAVPTETATLPPTFTPPALPFTSNEEHYWLQRPIPEGGTVWTDKSYSYGSTRGGALSPHHGVEFYVPTGTQVLAAASGTVVVAGSDADVAYGPQTNFYGDLVVIQLDSTLDGRPVYNLYGHLSQIQVSEGQRVSAFDPIALSGATGVADGPHLHFEVRLDQNSYDNTRNPLLWLYPFPDYGTVAGRITRPNGSLVEEAPVSLRRIDAPSRYLAATSYAGTTVNPDDQWQENFAIDDVPAGYYEITVGSGKTKVTQELWVFPYRTSFVEIEIRD